MQQRQPRVGDIVDDYCPRERRISDHAIVAMVTDAIRLVRCTTCDAEHEYKQAKVPLSRKRKVAAPAAQPAAAAPPAPQADGALVIDAEPDNPANASIAGQAAESANPPEVPDPDSSSDEPAGRGPEGSVHRRLIRATLPRVEGQVPVRPIPEFTMHRPTSPGKSFRGKGGRPQPGGSGAGPHRGPKGSGAHIRHAGNDRSPSHGQPGSFSPHGARGSHGPMGQRPPHGPHGDGGPGRSRKH